MTLGTNPRDPRISEREVREADEYIREQLTAAEMVGRLLTLETVYGFWATLHGDAVEHGSIQTSLDAARILDTVGTEIDDWRARIRLAACR